ncbi:cell wall integrity and stress response component 4-like [Haliotis rubra]|uniref:cell wall integrity and stress response component 4-like n=1 Tax=Haliotis rubra TaxID=36100 RepID=UPI001EE583E6|nr:cell wall integrity and stress response component 4-like [Haliotis rubra]
MNTEVRPEYYKDVPCVVRLNRKKRAVQNRNIDTEHRYKRQTPSEVWTNQTAAEFCNNLFAASSTVQLCRNVPGVNVDNSRDDCISDILLSGTTEFQMMSIDTVRSSCETEVLLNPDLWVADPQNPGAPSVFDTITNNVCPNDCRGRGTCQRGLCDCSAGFGGADCSVDLTQPPQLDEVEDNGHCDLATSSCQRLTVFGLTFLEDVTIKCRSTMFTVSNDGDLHQPNTQVTNAIERSLSEVECPVRIDAPRGIVTAYNISVANTDNIYSENVMVLVYDSTCVDVDNESKTWTVTNGYDVQNGRCISSWISGSPTDVSTLTPTSTSTSTTMSATTTPTSVLTSKSQPQSTSVSSSTPTSPATSTNMSKPTTTPTSILKSTPKPLPASTWASASEPTLSATSTTMSKPTTTPTSILTSTLKPPQASTWASASEPTSPATSTAMS